jgi:hypothetical protein
MPQATQHVYSTTDPATLATYQRVTAERDEFSRTIRAAAVAVGGNGDIYGSPGTTGEPDRFVYLGIRDDRHVPAGWQATRNGKRLLPKPGRAGREARDWLNAHQPPDVLHALAVDHGLPRQTWDLRTEAILPVDLFERDGELWAVYPIEPGSEQDFHRHPCTWTRRDRADLPARECTHV